MFHFIHKKYNLTLNHTEHLWLELAMSQTNWFQKCLVLGVNKSEGLNDAIVHHIYITETLK